MRENAVAKSKNPAPPRCPQNLKIVNFHDLLSSFAYFSVDAMSDEVDLSIAALLGQLAKAREYLSTSSGFHPTITRQSVAAMKECAECIIVLQSLRSNS